MRVDALSQLVNQRKNFLCVGLDPDVQRIPTHFSRDAKGIVEFNRHIIEATAPFCVSYKLNFAFYEALGKAGWRALEQTRKLLPATHFLIADAKRGDIGNTARKYAESIFQELQFDAVTLNAYMGRDVVDPFLEFSDKTVILLALTSNPGSSDFQLTKNENDRYLFEEVIEKSSSWANSSRMMYVVGATKPEYFEHVRALVPEHFLLVPGVGAQGGSLDAVYQNGACKNTGLLINSSRGILYADDSVDFANHAGNQAQLLANKMRELLSVQK